MSLSLDFLSLAQLRTSDRVALVSTWHTARVNSVHFLRDWTMPGLAPAGGRHWVKNTCSILYSLSGYQHLVFSRCGAAASWWSSPERTRPVLVGGWIWSAFPTICKTHTSIQKTPIKELIYAALLRNGAQSRSQSSTFSAPPLGMLYCIRKSPFWDHAKCTGCQSTWLQRMKLQENFILCYREIRSDTDCIRPPAQALEARRDFMWKTAQCLLFQSKAILAESRLVMW